MVARTDPEHCADCGGPVPDSPRCPPDGWQLEDGRTVCGKCATEDLKQTVRRVTFFADPTNEV